MKRVALTAALVGVLVACGSASTATEKVFRPKNPRLSLFLQVRGSEGVVAAVQEHLLGTGTLGGFIVAPEAQGRKDCTVTRTIGRGGPFSLQNYIGQELRITVYGKSSFAPRACQNFGKALAGRTTR